MKNDEEEEESESEPGTNPSRETNKRETAKPRLAPTPQSKTATTITNGHHDDDDDTRLRVRHWLGGLC